MCQLTEHKLKMTNKLKLFFFQVTFIMGKKKIIFGGVTSWSVFIAKNNLHYLIK